MNDVSDSINYQAVIDLLDDAAADSYSLRMSCKHALQSLLDENRRLQIRYGCVRNDMRKAGKIIDKQQTMSHELRRTAQYYVDRCPMCDAGMECHDDLCFAFRNALNIGGDEK